MTKEELKSKAGALLAKLNRRLKQDKEICKELLNRKRSVAYVCLVLSAYTMVTFNYPFFSYVSANVEDCLYGLWIEYSIYLLMFLLNYLIYYILLYLGRGVGKCIIALTLVCNALCLYFINTYNVLINESMIRNVFSSNVSEASSFFSNTMVCYALFLGVLPCIWLFRKKVEYGSVWKFLLGIIISLVAALGIAVSYLPNTNWIDSHVPVMGSKIMPWSYVINSIRYYNHWRLENQKEIILPDAEIVTDSKDICVLIIGESARSQNFSLYGYARNTNPLMMADGVTALNTRAAHTNTLDAVRAILQHDVPSGGELYEILPNYLSRNGVDVIWRSSNDAKLPFHIDKNYNKKALQELYPNVDGRYDGILYHGLKEEILACTKDKVFIGIHTYTSHGPEYYANTPESFKKFYPECRTVEMSGINRDELVNAYDNTLIYTDYLVHSVIETLRNEFPDRRSCVIFISDHGESLGEDGKTYMHGGLPASMAPAEQLDIPFIVWVSDNAKTKVKNLTSAEQGYIYHSVLKFLGLDTPIYDESKNIFE